jgi:hypothetical protein
MKQNEKFNNILNECLDRLLQGETVEQCLQSYPEQARELELLLRTARAARVTATIQPRVEYKARARYEFQSAVRDMIEQKNRRRSILPWQWKWQSGWAIALVVIIVVVLGGGGTVAVSSNSMPDSALYSLKLVSEQAQLAITISEVGKAELNAAFVDRRTDEIVYVVSKGDTQQIQSVSQLLNTNMENMTNLVAGGAVPATPLLENRDATMQSAQNQEPMMGIAAAPALSPAPVAVPPMVAVPKVPESAPSVDVREPSPTTAAKSVERNQDTPSTLKTTDARISDRDKIKQIIVNNFIKNHTRLETALETASPEVKPAIRQVIASSTAEYEKALKNIERAEKAD